MGEVIVPAVVKVRTRIDEIYQAVGKMPIAIAIESGLFCDLIREIREMEERMTESVDPLSQVVCLSGVVVYPEEYIQLINDAVNMHLICPVCFSRPFHEQIDEIIREESKYPL